MKLTDGQVFAIIFTVAVICGLIMVFTHGKGIVIDKPVFPRVQITTGG